MIKTSLKLMTSRTDKLKTTLFAVIVVVIVFVILGFTYAVYGDVRDYVYAG